MSNLATLFRGELERMKKYHILTASIVAALILFGVLYLINTDDVSSLFPLLLFIDATSMSILLIGATVFFEKQEGILFYGKFYIQKGIILKKRGKRLVCLHIGRCLKNDLGGGCYEGISEKL